MAATDEFDSLLESENKTTVDAFDFKDFFEDWLAEVLDEDSDFFLTANETNKAIRLNRRYARSLGWQVHFDRIVKLLAAEGYLSESRTPSHAELAEALAYWQLNQRDLAADGIIGPSTWARMQRLLGIRPQSRPSRITTQVLCPPPPDMTPAERTALGITSLFETGIPYGCPVSSTDGISMGMLQWNLAAGTLQDLLARFESQTGRLQEIFGPETARLRRLIALRGPRELRQQAVREAKDEDLALRWRTALLNLCADPQFCRLLREGISQTMRRARDSARQLGLRTVRGLTMMFDIINGDGLSSRKENAFLRITSSLQPEQEKLLQIAREASRWVNERYQRARRLRRELIARGYTTERFRNRTDWDLKRAFPNLDEPWDSL